MAVVWKITPLFAEWISAPDNFLFVNRALSPNSTILELGCGVNAVVALALSPSVTRYVLTDQAYVAKLVERNLEENRHLIPAATGGAGSQKHKRKAAVVSTSSSRVRFIPLDWETDQITPMFTGDDSVKSFDAVFACDCIYNEALIEPFVQTCVDACKLKLNEDALRDEFCVCVVAQQLRDHNIFEAWLTRFCRDFCTWRVPDPLLSESFQSNPGFVIHIGVLKQAAEGQEHK
jgi:hypothetical protein